MIQRSYRTIFLRLNQGFCKNKGQQPPNNNPSNTNKNKQSQSGLDKKTYKSRQSKMQRQKQKSQKKQLKHQVIKQQKSGDHVHKKVQQKQKNLATKVKKQKKQMNKTNSVTSWANTQFTETKLKILQQQSKAKEHFAILQKRNEVQAQLSKYVDGLNLQIQHKNLLSTMKQYLKVDFTKALKFFYTSILPAKATSEQSKFSIDQIMQLFVKQYIKEQNIEGLLQFLQTLDNQYKKRNQGCLDYGDKNILTDLQMISDFSQSSLKYEILSKFLKITKLPHNKSQVTKKIQFMLKNIIQKFVNRADNQVTIIQSFEKFLNTIVQNRLLPPKIIKSDSFWQAIEAIYFFRCNTQQKYDNFFKIIGSLKASIASQDDYLEQFYKKFYSTLINAQLKTTNAETAPLKVNSKLISKYKQFFEAQNKQGVLTIFAICLLNNYFSIPQHFLAEYKNGFSKIFMPTVISALKEDFTLVQLNQNSKNRNRQTKYLQNDLVKSSKKITKLKALIINKDYNKAMEIFTNQYFKKPCIQKERIITLQVLKQFVATSANQQLNQREQSKIYERISEFTHQLPEDYLWESWKKREDLGYLFQDYYQKQGQKQQVVQQAKELVDKAQKRFSYWDKYFETKRASEINSYEKQNELSKIKQPNPYPYIQTQFNLNQLLSPQNYERYRQVADYDERKQVELALYFYKVQATLEQMKVLVSEKVGQKILSFQEQLCEQNLSLLQDFGIKDYNIDIHDQQQFENRLANFKKYRGILRLNDIYHRMFLNPKEYIPVFGKEMNKKAQDLVVEEKTEQIEDQSPVQDDREHVAEEEQVKKESSLQSGTQKNEQHQSKAQQITKAQDAVEEKLSENQQNQEAVVQEKQQIGKDAAEQAITHVSSMNAEHDFCKQQDKINLINTEFLDILRVKSRDYFQRAAINTMLEPLPIVNELLVWGLFYKQPMAIYMAEKLAMVTGQIIPHHLAIRVSDFLSFYREIDQQLFVDCKKCLTHIGKIEREFIYDNNKGYHHIYYKPKFSSMVQQMNKSLRDRLEDLVLVPSQFKYLSNEPREVMRRASKGSVF